MVTFWGLFSCLSTAFHIIEILEFRHKDDYVCRVCLVQFEPDCSV